MLFVYSLTIASFLFVLLQDLVSSMLHVEPRCRPTTHQILQHAWITRRDNLPTNRIHLPEPTLIKVSTGDPEIEQCIVIGTVSAWESLSKIVASLPECCLGVDKFRVWVCRQCLRRCASSLLARASRQLKRQSESICI
jgi:serine/threonine protein kinase